MTNSLERFWEDFLLFIEERRVIPVIGPELVTVGDGEGDVPLDRWIARRLVPVLELPAAELPESFDLNDVVSLHLRRRGDRDELYPRIFSILRGAALSPPATLRAIAGISGFDLFVSLTFDSLLAEAVSAARPGGPRAEQIAYAPNALHDLASAKSGLRQPVVFHLLGRASSSPEYAICDEDLLEFLHAMQDKQRQPKMLFDELRGNHLLILGCGYGDWLARFFLRTARSVELSQKRKRWDVLVDDRIARDAGLGLFLESFSPETRVLPLTASEFVAELARRWQESHPAETAGAPPEESLPESGSRDIPAGAIFVSYPSDNRDAADRLTEGLRAAGLQVWFDRDALQMGDDWLRSIRRGIERCSLFVPVISREALSPENRRRFFWREWMEADDFARGMAPGEVFIVPVMIDDTRIDRVDVPDSFKKAQGRVLPDGKVAPEVAESLKHLVRDFHRRRA